MSLSFSLFQSKDKTPIKETYMYKLILALAILTSTLYAQDNKATNDELKQLSAKCREYIKVFAEKDELQTWNKKLDQRIEQRITDNQTLDEDSAMRDIALDWLAGSETQIKEKKPEQLKISCFYFIRFIDINHTMPTQVRERLTSNSCTKMIEMLDEQLKKKEINNKK